MRVPGRPQALEPSHVVRAFDCGVATLDDWLQRRALPNQVSGASRTFVCLDDAHQVVAYYALASSAIAPSATPGRFRRNIPDPIPVVVFGRLAVSRDDQGRGLGRALFQDAARRVLHAADAIGVRGLLVHALSAEAKAFYLGLGMEVSPIDPMTLLVTLSDLRAAHTQE